MSRFFVPKETVKANEILIEGEDAVKIKDALAGFSAGSIAIAIGPEGDFTAREIEGARASGFKVVNLGERVLKSDTAGLAALSMINYEFSN